jgi:Bacterial pre-peptidase C-terminal domain
MIAALWMALPALADEKDAETCLRNKVWDGYAQGWGVRTMTSASIPDGKTRNYLVTLYEGNEYQVQACTDENVVNLDLLLYDTQGNVITRDPVVAPGTEDREPTVSFRPPATGTYYIVLYNRKGKTAEAIGGVAMAVVYR